MHLGECLRGCVLGSDSRDCLGGILWEDYFETAVCDYSDMECGPETAGDRIGRGGREIREGILIGKGL